MAWKETARKILGLLGLEFVDMVEGETSNEQVAEAILGRVQELVGVWSGDQPALPTEPWMDNQALAYWKVRCPRLNLHWGILYVWALGGAAYGTILAKQDEGTVEVYQRFQVRDGKLWGRRDRQSPWDLESTGWEYAGAVEFPEDVN